MGVFIKDPANQLLKVQELNLLKMQERNISSYWERAGEKLRYLKVIFKKVFDYIISYLSNLFLMSVNNLFAKILDDPLLMYLY